MYMAWEKHNVTGYCLYSQYDREHDIRRGQVLILLAPFYSFPENIRSFKAIDIQFQVVSYKEFL